MVGWLDVCDGLVAWHWHCFLLWLQLSSLGIESHPTMAPVTLNMSATAVVVSSDGQSVTTAWGAGNAVGTSGSGTAFPVIVSCGMDMCMTFCVGRVGCIPSKVL